MRGGWIWRINYQDNSVDKIDLENAIKNLEPQTREMIKMKYYLGYKIDEIATILEIPVGTVKGKMYTALKNLRKELKVIDYENRW